MKLLLTFSGFAVSSIALASSALAAGPKIPLSPEGRAEIHEYAQQHDLHNYRVQITGNRVNLREKTTFNGTPTPTLPRMETVAMGTLTKSGNVKNLGPVMMLASKGPAAKAPSPKALPSKVDLRTVEGDQEGRVLLHGAQFLGKMDPRQTMNISVYPETANLTAPPSKADVDAITAWAKTQGFRVTPQANGTYLSLSGSAAEVERAFHVSLGNYKLGANAGMDKGMNAFATADAPKVPAGLNVKMVLGLNNVRVAVPLREAQ
jgi:hypothetical protein